MTGDFTRTHFSLQEAHTSEKPCSVGPSTPNFPLPTSKVSASQMLAYFIMSVAFLLMKQGDGHLNFRTKKAIYLTPANLENKRDFFKSLTDYTMFFLHFTMLPLRWLFVVVVNETKIILPVGSWKITNSICSQLPIPSHFFSFFI